MADTLTLDDARDSSSSSGSNAAGASSDDTASDERDLTSGPEWAVLAKLAGPMCLGLLSVLSVGLVDTFFVGKLGTDQLAALSFAFPVTVAVTGLCIGAGVGTASVVSRRTGEGRDEDAEHAALSGILLGLLVVSLVAAGIALSAGPLFSLLGADPDTLPHIVDYIPVYMASVPFLAASIILHNISRSVGEANWPMGIMAVSGLLNIGLTAGLVFGLGPFPELGILGAALGTLLARGAIVWTSVWLVSAKLDVVDWHLPDLRALLPDWRAIAKVAVPSAAGNIVNPLSITVITAILAGFAQDAVAGFGVARQVQSLGAIPLLAMSSAIGPIAGQNWGAEKPARITATLKIAYGVSLAWAGLLAGSLWLFGDTIAGVFSDEASVTDEAVTYLRIVPISLFGFGMAIVSAAAFNGLGQSARGLAFYLVRAVALLVPLAFIGSLLAEARGVYIGMAIANGVGGLLVAAYALRWLKRNADTACKD